MSKHQLRQPPGTCFADLDWFQFTDQRDGVETSQASAN